MDRTPRLDRTALVVDDDAFVRSALAELLSEEGYDVHTATNGFSAVRQALELRPAVILLDLVLPELSGNDVLLELRNDPLMREVAIVVVTAHAEDLTDIQLAETDGVVSKPFDVADLVNTVHRAVQRAAARRAEVAPVAAVARRDSAPRQRRAPDPRRTHGRR
jgi:two-component system response regulator (stage 0 sporulation protein F)